MKHFMVSFFIGVLLPQLSYAQSVKIQAEKGYDVSGYATFKVEDGDIVTVVKGEVDKKAILAGITKAITDDLKSKGYQHYPDSGSALLITFVAEVVETVDIANVGPLGQQPASRASDMDQSQTWSRESKQGSLLIEIVDRQKKKTIWRSTITIDFGSNEISAALNSAVFRCLRKLPRAKK